MNFTKKNQSGIGFSSPRAFQRWSRNCRNPFVFSGNWCFMCVHWWSNPAVFSSPKELQFCQLRILRSDRTTALLLPWMPWCGPFTTLFARKCVARPRSVMHLEFINKSGTAQQGRFRPSEGVPTHNNQLMARRGLWMHRRDPFATLFARTRVVRPASVT